VIVPFLLAVPLSVLLVAGAVASWTSRRHRREVEQRAWEDTAPAFTDDWMRGAR
jgi:Sec-independent protein secretion pathway component TatC